MIENIWLGLQTLPKVNRELAMKLISLPVNTKKKTGNLLEDDRFKDMFANPDFEVDKTVEEYRLLNPVVSKLEKKKAQKLEALFAPVEVLHLFHSLCLPAPILVRI